jgi:hypothetical protein
LRRQGSAKSALNVAIYPERTSRRDLDGRGPQRRLHEVYVATLGPPVSARQTDVVTYPTMNRASGTRGCRYFERNADKMLGA